MINLRIPKLSDLLSDEEIYSYYMETEIELGKAYLSPLRKEKNPSFALYKASTGRIYWSDKGTGEWGSVTGLVMLLYGLTLSQAVERIKKDILFNEKREIKEWKSVVKPLERSKYVFSVDSRAFNRNDYKYWADYGISPETLSKYEIKPCRRLVIYREKVAKSVFYELRGEPQYSFKFGNNYKIYRPYSKIKWLSNIGQTNVQGLKQLPKEGKLLVIQKSLKDVLLLRELAISAIAPSSEVTFVSEEILNDLKKRFKRIIIWFDHDETGITMATKFGAQYNLSFVTTDDPENKDITDYFKAFGPLKTQKLITNKLDI